MNGFMGQHARRRSITIHLSPYLVKSDGSEHVRFTKRIKGLHKGDICRR